MSVSLVDDIVRGFTQGLAQAGKLSAQQATAAFDDIVKAIPNFQDELLRAMESGDPGKFLRDTAKNTAGLSDDAKTLLKSTNYATSLKNVHGARGFIDDFIQAYAGKGQVDFNKVLTAAQANNPSLTASNPVVVALKAESQKMASDPAAREALRQQYKAAQNTAGNAAKPAGVAEQAKAAAQTMKDNFKANPIRSTINTATGGITSSTKYGTIMRSAIGVATATGSSLMALGTVIEGVASDNRWLGGRDGAVAEFGRETRGFGRQTLSLVPGTIKYVAPVGYLANTPLTAIQSGLRPNPSVSFKFVDADGNDYMQELTVSDSLDEYTGVDSYDSDLVKPLADQFNALSQKERLSLQAMIAPDNDRSYSASDHAALKDVFEQEVIIVEGDEPVDDNEANHVKAPVQQVKAPIQNNKQLNAIKITIEGINDTDNLELVSEVIQGLAENIHGWPYKIQQRLMKDEGLLKRYLLEESNRGGILNGLVRDEFKEMIEASGVEGLTQDKIDTMAYELSSLPIDKRNQLLGDKGHLKNYIIQPDDTARQAILDGLPQGTANGAGGNNRSNEPIPSVSEALANLIVPESIGADAVTNSLGDVWNLVRGVGYNSKNFITDFANKNPTMATYIGVGIAGLAAFKGASLLSWAGNTAKSGAKFALIAGAALFVAKLILDSRNGGSTPIKDVADAVASGKVGQIAKDMLSDDAGAAKKPNATVTSTTTLPVSATTVKQETPSGAAAQTTTGTHIPANDEDQSNDIEVTVTGDRKCETTTVGTLLNGTTGAPSEIVQTRICAVE